MSTALAVALAFLLSLGVIATPAHAHTDLVSTAPADGDVLDAAPAAVTLTFNEELLEAAVRVSITDENGAVVAKDIATSTGSDVTVPWPEDLEAGTYTVSYRVVSGDGHPVSGDITFTFGAPATVEESEPSATVTPIAESAEPVVTETDAPAEPVVIESPAASESSDSPATAVIVGLVIAGALIAALVVWNRRRS